MSVKGLVAQNNSVNSNFHLDGGGDSGAVEPVGALLTIRLTSLVTPVLPYLLAFAAGAMLYVVVEDLIPQATSGKHSNMPVICFGIGFLLMMLMDTILG